MGEELVVAVFDEEGDAWNAVTAAEAGAQRRGAWTRRLNLEDVQKLTAA